jgi:hypothetical protein
MRHVPITLQDAVSPVVVGWPVGQLYADMPEWQKDDAQNVIEQARKTLTASLGESKPPLHGGCCRSPNKLSWSCWGVAAAGGFPACCWDGERVHVDQSSDRACSDDACHPIAIYDEHTVAGMRR